MEVSFMNATLASCHQGHLDINTMCTIEDDHTMSSGELLPPAVKMEHHGMPQRATLLQSNAGPIKPQRRIRREIANQNEQRRIQRINHGFEQLREFIPHVSREKLSKAAILQHAVDYVKNLQDITARLQHENRHLKRYLSTRNETAPPASRAYTYADKEKSQSNETDPSVCRQLAQESSNSVFQVGTSMAVPAPTLEDLQYQELDTETETHGELANRRAYEARAMRQMVAEDLLKGDGRIKRADIDCDKRRVFLQDSSRGAPMHLAAGFNLETLMEATKQSQSSYDQL
eukprot:Colp12_sorted_trinity150504_noHs@27825